jgi:hypothetical protein
MSGVRYFTFGLTYILDSHHLILDISEYLVYELYLQVYISFFNVN